MIENLMPGTTTVDQDVAPARLILALDGPDKGGKTHFAATAPRPLVYLDTDVGHEGVVDKADRPDLIIKPPPFSFRASEVTWEIDEAAKSAAIMKAAEPELERFRQLYYHALTEPVLAKDGVAYKAKTIVIDNASEIWELLRLCYLGKLTQVKPHHYTEVNGLMRDLVRAAYDNDVNVIWIHKLKQEYKEGVDGRNSKSGTMERIGFGDMSYLVQANLLAYRTPSSVKQDAVFKWRPGSTTIELGIAGREDPQTDLGFKLFMGNCRQDPTAEGEVWFNEQIDFAQVAMRLRPEVDPSEWYTNPDL